MVQFVRSNFLSDKKCPHFYKTLAALRTEGIQIIILDSQEIYSEYAPYSYVEDMKVFIDKVSQLSRIGW